MKMKVVLLLLSVAVLGCNSGAQHSSRFDFDTWTLIKTHHIDEAEPLYASFGPVTYDIYINPVLGNKLSKSGSIPVNSEIAILVYAGDRTPQKPALVGFISKSGAGISDSSWKITAYDAKKNPLSEQQVATSCYGCHSASDDSIILGAY